MADMVHYSVAASEAEILFSFSPTFHCSRCWLLEERGLGHVGKKLTQVYSLNKFERVGKYRNMSTSIKPIQRQRS